MHCYSGGAALDKARQLALEFLDGLGDRPVARPVDYAALVETAGGPLPDDGQDPACLIEQMARSFDPGIIGSAGPRYFGFVTGGALPAAAAADWLAVVWDQNGFNSTSSPAAAAVEDIAARWLLDLLGLPSQMSVGFTTGCTMSSFTALAAARHALLHRAGWDVERQGLFGAPPITVITSEESHVTIFAALQMLGFGRDRVTRIPADEQGRMRTPELRVALRASPGPQLVCAQAGNVNTGAFDPIAEIAASVHEAGGWLHVDGAFGLWAAASPAYRSLLRGIEQADSIASDCHKWLNVPYDSGVVFVRDVEAHRTAMMLAAPYYGQHSKTVRDNYHWVPEASRRARGFAVYAALRSLGRRGVAAMIERCCALAQRMAQRLSSAAGVQILNDVILNQVLVRFSPPVAGDADAFTAEVVRRVQDDGTCWASGTVWKGMHAIRISVSNWSTSEADIDASVEAILRCAAPSG
ncbi:MAG TPA: aminotransferase class V-fold PLP-dependent enzyme [Bryobacteraceae bacterium]|nr:aminotransferase class V-fold PLP-dependent enzyme [Bryobacteraceae bacterium]